ncbi:type I secretion system permease/ATPase [Xanthobacter sp. KR7-65]|uniref:type I secretion system permease/ATPase n=1 Tax=Xanthobacter sp. KR7-65 TaxID=3156612 RepID=UPI0032B4C1C6
MNRGPGKRRTGRSSDKDLPSRALSTCRQAFLAVAIFSAVVNVLMLAGSLYMLQVYDRVLPSRSVPTLVALTIAVAMVYAVQGLFDALRQRILGRIGVALDQSLSGEVARTILKGAAVRRGDGGTMLARDLDAVRIFLSGVGPMALFDLPWIPLYVGACFLLHPVLGSILVVGATLLVALTFLTEMRTRHRVEEAGRAGAARSALLEQARRNGEVVAALGLTQRLIARLDLYGDAAVAAQQHAADISGGLGAISKVLRFMLQSGMLGAGAWLVIEGQASSGVMIASSVIASRALAPVELAISSWRPFLAARQAWQRLRQALAIPRSATLAVAPERARHRLTLDHVTVAAPGATTAVLSQVSFAMEAGQVLGIVGPSASGKSSLARVLVGVWPPAHGELRLDGATLDQWPEDVRGAMLGYLPQDVELFDGTVAETIARFDPAATDEAVRAAARAAGAYEMILRLPEGFGTRIGEGGGILSGGQRQRLALARALYGDPFLVVLDEPNASLDAEGEAALVAAIQGVKARGGICVVIAHRPAALAMTDLVLVVVAGRVQAFGPRDEVLKRALAGRSGHAEEKPPKPRIVAERA